MFDITRFNINELHDEYISAQPFQHIIIDNFLDSSVLKEVELSLRELTPDKWIDNRNNGYSMTEQDSVVQSKKVGLNNYEQLPGRTKDVFDLFHSKEMIDFLEGITGIKGVQVDNNNLGGGVHKIKKGGRLAIHADFNFNNVNQKYRRINILLYLNSEWKEEYNGCLELWSSDMMTCMKKIGPIFNRLVIFNTLGKAYHGHPELWDAPDNYDRLSIALYYYTDDLPEEHRDIGQTYGATWQLRKGIEF
jgi:Rps23 Pro-64 3,4-dihydroxylase Tpa1-like proline 4-hydroxylase